MTGCPDHIEYHRSIWQSVGVAAVLLALAALSGCQRESDFMRINGPTMGTDYALTCRCPGVTAERIQAAVTSELSVVNAQMSTYLDQSELSRFNAAPTRVWQPLSEDLATVIGAALDLNDLSGGAFDVTVGPLVNLWGFGPDGEITDVPSEDAIFAARQRVGRGYLELDESRSVLLKTRSVLVDLSAIAKGHAVDRLAVLLTRHRCSDFLVDIGGEVIGRGMNPAGSPWRIGIEVPDPERLGAVARVLSFTDRAVATSGDYRNFLDLAGQRVSHTIDPRSGYPVTHGLASVSVVHESAMWADGFATAMNVLGPEAGFALALDEDLAAFFLIRQADGFEERYTPAMLTYLDSSP